MSTESQTRPGRRRPSETGAPPREGQTPIDPSEPDPPSPPAPTGNGAAAISSPPSPGMRLLAAVVLAAIIGVFGGAVAAWAIYAHFGPVERIVSVPTKGDTGQGPTVGQLAQSKASSVVMIATQPITPDGLVNAGTGFANGVVVSADGLILTSVHAIQGATQLRIGLADGRGFDATVAGVDIAHGLVALRAAGAGNLTPLSFSGTAPAAGDLAIAVSRPPLGALSLGVGTVSSTGRAVEMDRSTATVVADAFTIDANAEPQADGAPVLDSAGGLIGIVATVTQATPPPGLTALSGQAGKALTDRVSSGNHASRASFGADAAFIDAAYAAAERLTPGALIRSVDPSGAAAAAGLHPGDIVTAVNGTSIDASHPFDAAVLGLQPGDQATVTVVSGGASRAVSLVVGSSG